MPGTDRRIDASIATSAPFAPPILEHLRAVVHAACPPRTRKADQAMGDLGRITAVKDLPSKRVLTGWIRQAMKLNEEGVKAAARKTAAPRKALPLPADLRAALAGNRRAAATFEAFAPSHRREYIEWIVEARQEATRERRIEQAIEWMAEGKERHWKYRKK